MPRVASKAHNERTSKKVRVSDLTNAQIECRGMHGHMWVSDPGANWHTPKYDYIHCYRFYFRCERGCGVVKVGVWTKDGRWVTGFTRYPAQYRVTGIGRGAGRAPFRQEFITRQNITPTGKQKVSDKARRRSAS